MLRFFCKDKSALRLPYTVVLFPLPVFDIIVSILDFTDNEVLIMENRLDRFLSAQERSYDTALREIRSGRKRSHWMWYIFPQIAGLGMSSTAQYYSIADLSEAKDYIAHPVLGARLIEISEALLTLDSSDATSVMGYPDDLKLRSSMTLFAQVSGNPVFSAVLDKFYGGSPDTRTLRILGLQ